MQAFGPKEAGARAGAAARCAAVADQDRLRRGRPNHDQRDRKGARRSIRPHLIIGLALVLVLAGGFGGWASTVPISGALIAPGSVVVDSNVKKVQHPTGGVVGEVRVRDGDMRQGRRHRGAARRDRGQGEPRHRRQDPERIVGARGAAGGRAARPRQDQVSADARRSRRRSRRQGRHGERDQIVRGSRQRPRRTEGAVARAGHAAERGNRRPHGAGEGQGQGNRAGGKGAGRRPPAL